MPGRHLRFRLLATLALTTGVALAPVTVAHASGVTVTDLTNGVTATQLAQSLAGGGVAISNVTFTGADRAAGSFSGGTASIGFDGGVVLSSGYVQTHTGEAGTCSQGVEGPNDCYEATGGGSGGADGGQNSTGLGTAGDTSLDALAAGTTQDASVLEFDFVPSQSTVHFSYVFSSEEYSDFSNTGFNDVFGFFVNGTNCALVPGTSDPVSINTINNGNDAGGDTTAHNANLFRDNVRPSPTIDSQMDGLTTVLTCTASVNAGQTNHMKIAIADVGDSAYDSAVFIEAGSLVAGNTLTVDKSGNGAGTVTSSPTGINCGSSCSAQYSGGTMVTLTATPATGSTFAGWSGGGCSGTGTCQVTMNADTTVTATFTLVKHTLTVSKSGGGSGSVTSSPAGIDCGATCSHDYDYGTVVTLTATPAAGSIFAGWSGGGCSGTGTCQVTMSADTTVTATFVLGHTLTVSRAGNGSGSVSSSPAGIDCGATCTAGYADGTMVTLTATPATGSTFTGWSGGGCSGTGTCQVTVNADTSVTATFTLVKHTLTVSKAGTGSGAVSSSPAGIDCGATCSAQYDYGTSVTLTATPASGSTFAGWSGACSGTGSCIVTMDQERAVTATFNAIPPAVPAISIGDATVDPEGNSGTKPASFAVSLSAATTQTVTVQYGTVDGTATAPADYTAASGTVTFAPGETSKTITVAVVGDTLPEPDETFTVNLGSPVNATVADGSGLGTIVDDDQIVATGGLFCGTQHRGRCTGLKVKDQFDRPGNASWTFAAYNPAPGNSARAVAAKKRKIILGKVTKKVKRGTVTFVFKLTGAKANRLLKQVAKAKLKYILITRTFTPAGGSSKEVVTTVVKLKR